MQRSAKASQIQIRVTASQKTRIQQAARRAGLGMSAYVLGRVLPEQSGQWRERPRELARDDGSRLAPVEREEAWERAKSRVLAALENPPLRGRTRIRDRGALHDRQGLRR